VKLGVMFELSGPRPFERDTERTVFGNALDQIRPADERAFTGTETLD